MRRVESIVSSGGVVSAAIPPDGEYLYHLTPSGVLRSRVSDGLLIDRLRVPGDAGLIRIASSGSVLLAAASGAGPLSLIRLR